MSEQHQQRSSAGASFVTHLVGDRSGVIIVMFALMLPVILGFLGLGVEVGRWYQSRRGLQSAADAAAIAAVYSVWDGGSTSDAYTDAFREANRNWSPDASDNLTSGEFSALTIPPGSGSYTADVNAIEVDISKTASLMFVGYLMKANSISINARSVATLGTSSEACVLALGTTGTGFSASGNSTVNLNSCSIAVNSTDSTDAMTTNGGSTTISADCYSVVGGTNFQDPDNVTTTCSSGATAAHAVADPYASLAAPDTSSMTTQCSSTLTCDTAVATGSLSEGIYSQLTLQGSVDLAAGVYVIDGGALKMNGGAVITNSDGLGVTFFLTNDASVTVNGSADVTLSAPTDSSNTYYGVLFYGDRNNTVGNSHTISGGADVDFSGAIYFSQGDITISGSSSLDSTCIQIIADTLTISGDSSMDNNCTMLNSASGNSINIQEVSLVE